MNDIVERLRKSATHELVSDDIALEAADAIETLRAEVSAINVALLDEAAKRIPLMQEAHELRAQVETLQADAERYRWLRDDAGALSVFTSAYWNTTTPEQLDAEIDAARKG